MSNHEMDDKDKQYGSPFEHWKQDFKAARTNNAIEQIAHIPDSENMAGVMYRANFNNENQRRAAVQLYAINLEMEDDRSMEVLRVECSSTMGRLGLGKSTQVMVHTGIIPPEMWRDSLGLPKRSGNGKEKEEGAYRRSDFRADGANPGNMGNRNT